MYQPIDSRRPLISMQNKQKIKRIFPMTKPCRTSIFRSWRHRQMNG